ncbi:uncharacterized protein PgNI_01401 [Pyricularia grisea]|uniref:Uncharacterized protein n=1 Tax=Pyricularia grisea TaxID=148305 RepID=A0A6P8BKF1_PYRGI|nr:uncharacterized protein PgNI_01401 [Pyricularia grisea]TLD17052.1 hypothetical protein PgNI_01401 [Pyricularia grisea]
MKTTAIFSALSTLAFVTTGIFAANCHIVKRWKGAQSIIVHDYYRAPDDRFHLHQHVCTSDRRCTITCENLDSNEWEVAGVFNKAGQDIEKVNGQDKGTVWDPRTGEGTRRDKQIARNHDNL